MKTKIKLILGSALVLFFSSCSSKSDSLKTIPDSAKMVVSIDLESLYSKGQLSDLEDFKMIKFIQEEIKNEDQTVRDFFTELIDDPRMCGLNLREDLFIYPILESRDNNYMCISAELSDEAEFIGFMDRFLKATNAPYKFKIKERDNFKIAQLKSDMAIGWNDDVVLFCTPQNYSSRDNLEYCINQAFNLNPEKSLAESELFEGFNNDKEDINVFVSSELLLEDYYYQEIAKELEYDLKNNAIFAHLDFEEDQLHVKCKTVLNESLLKAVKQMDFDETLDDDVLEYLPSTNYIVGGVHMNMENYVSSMKEQKNFDEIAKEIEKELGYTLDEIAEAFEGDIAFNIFDFVVVESYYTSTTPLFAVVMNVSDEDLITDLMKKFEEEGFRKVNGYYSLNIGGETSLCFALNDDHVMITNEEGTIKKFLDGPFQNNLGDEDIADVLSDYPMSMAMKLNVLDYPQSVIQSYNDTRGNDKELLDLWNKTFKDMEAKMIDANTYEIDVNLIPDGENSFYRLLKVIDDNFEKFF